MANVESVLHGKTAGLPNSVWVIIVGGAVVFGYWKRKKSATASAAKGNDPNALDPETGMTYGQEAQLGYSVGQNPITFLNVTPPPIAAPPAAAPAAPAPATDWKQEWFYTSHAGDTYASVAKIAFPHATASQQAAAASKIAEMNSGLDAPNASPGVGALLHIGSLTDWVNAGFKNTLNSAGTGYNVSLGPALAPPPYGGSGVGAGVGKPAGIAPLNMPAGTYVIQPGDQLHEIANNYGMRWQDLYNANRNVIKNPSMVPDMAGVQIHIPT